MAGSCFPFMPQSSAEMLPLQRDYFWHPFFFITPQFCWAIIDRPKLHAGSVHSLNLDICKWPWNHHHHQGTRHTHHEQSWSGILWSGELLAMGSFLVGRGRVFRKGSAGHSTPTSRARLQGRQTWDACSDFFLNGKNIKTGSFDHYGEKNQVTIIVSP